jgi:hypothetical protein
MDNPNNKEFIRELSNFSLVNYENIALYKDKFTGEDKVAEYKAFLPHLVYLEMQVEDGDEFTDSCKGMTITLSGPSYAELKQVKASLKIVFKTLYHLFLEREVICQDLVLFNNKEAVRKIINSYEEIIENDENAENTYDLRKDLVVYSRTFDENVRMNNNIYLLNEFASATLGFFTKLLTERTDKPSLLTNNKFSCTILHLISMNFSDFPDLSNLSPNDIKVLEDSIKPWQKIKASYLAQVCNEAESVGLEFYGPGDVNLGTFIVQQAAGLDARCETCKRPKYYHTAFYYGKNMFIKINTEVIGHDKIVLHKEFTRKTRNKMLQEESEKSRLRATSVANIVQGPGQAPEPSNTTVIAKTNSGFFGGMMSSLFKKDSKKIIIDENDTKLKMSTNKNKSFSSHHQKIIIFTYIECTKCRRKLTPIMELGKEYLEISFSRYLECMLDNGNLYQEMYRERLEATLAGRVRSPSVRVITTKKIEIISELPELGDHFSHKPDPTDESPKLSAGGTFYDFDQEPKRSTGRSNTMGPINLKELGLALNGSKRVEIFHCCLDSVKARVFQFDKLLIKMKVGYAPSYAVETLDWYSEKTVGLLKQANDNMTKRKFADLKINWNILMQMTLKNVESALLNLMDKSKLDINLDNLPKIHSILNPNNPLSKNPLNKLLLELAPIYEDLKKLDNKAQKIFSEAKFSSHLEIDYTRILLYYDYKPVVEYLEKAKFNLATASQFSPTESMRKRRDTSSKKLEPIPNPENFELSDAQNFVERDRKASFLFPTELKPSTSEISGDTDNNNTSPSEVSINQKDDTTSFLSSTKEDEDKERQILKNLMEGLTQQENQNFGLYKFIPLNDKDPLTPIANTLNSQQYIREIYEGEGFAKMIEENLTNSNKLKHDPVFKAYIKKKLFFVTEKEHVFSYNISQSEIQLRLLNPILQSLPIWDRDNEYTKRTQTIDLLNGFTGINIKTNPSLKTNDKIITPNCSIKVHYAVQFEALRSCNNIVLSSFLKSISSSVLWKDNQGGKTGATFFKSYDQLYVFKQVKQSDFDLLSKSIANYFDYMWTIYDTGKPSLLAKIYGIYELQIEKETFYFMAMENLFFGVEPDAKKRVYDLKGSESNRYAKPHKTVMLDTNFKLDQNGEPLSISIKDSKWVMEAIENDTTFLADNNVIDYSMLLIVNEDSSILRMGIIDYAILYTFVKYLETKGKTFIRGTTPTIINPVHYKERFVKAMKQYLMGVQIE